MMRLSINAVSQAVLLNSGQVPILTFDQSLYATIKIQWNWPSTYGEKELAPCYVWRLTH